MTSRPLYLLSCAILVLVMTGCASASRTGTTADATDSPGYRYLTSDEGLEQARDRLTHFASDAMEGRETASPGERRATDYLAEEFRRLGVLPAGDATTAGERSYFQTFDVRTVGVDLDAMTLRDASGQRAPFRYGEHWVSFPQYLPEASLQNLPVVFMGYGLPNDYAGRDVMGKLVVAMSGVPSGENPASWPQKAQVALQAGAAAIAFVDEPFVRDNWGGVYPAFVQPGMALAEAPAGQSFPLPFFFIAPNHSDAFLEAVGAPASVRQDAAAGRAITPLESSLRLDLQTKIVRQTLQARNVVGYLPGTSKPEEYVAFGAHLDGHGTANGVIYNGADDDGSGTIGILGVAEAFARDRAAGQMTDRSLLFVFHTGEEKGLLGSKFFTDHAERSVLDSLRQIVAQINVDMVAREHPDSLYTVGSYRLSTEYGRRVDALNEALGEDGEPLFHFNRQYDEPDDPENIYERSDHFNYAKHGIPIVFFTDGMGANWQKNSPSDDYHRATDDVDKIDFGKMLRTMELIYAVGRVTAEAPRAPVVDVPAETTSAP